MNQNSKLRVYAAPTAQVICLAPVTPIASSEKKSWEWQGTSGSGWNTNHWGVDMSGLNPSVTGIMKWVGDDEFT